MANPSPMKEFTPEEMIEMLNRAGSMKRVADNIGVSLAGVFRYCQRHGIKKHEPAPTWHLELPTPDPQPEQEQPA